MDNCRRTIQAKKEQVSSAVIAELCTEIEKFGKEKLAGREDAIKRRKLASRIVEIERQYNQIFDADDYLDSVKEIDEKLHTETKNVLRFVETMGIDIFDEEREKET